MKDIFMFSFNAVMPILLMMLLGYFLKTVHFADEAFFKKANTLVFKVFLPTLLFINVYDIESLAAVNWRAVIYTLLIVLVLCGAGLILTKLLFRTRSKIGPLCQCSFRSNYAIIGIPLAETLGGSAGVGFACVLSAVAIPLFNVLAVVILSHYSSEKQAGSVKATIKKTATNPLIIGVLLGVIVLAIRSALPLNAEGEIVFSIARDLPWFYSALKTVAKGTTALALIVLGARFDFSRVSSLLGEITFGTLMRLVVAPLVGIGTGILLSENTSLINITATEYPALISLFASPIAVSSAVMVGEIGGDEQLAGQLVVWTSVFSMFTMFGTIFIMKSFGFI
ncbi:MAG: AEC family transporter [Clostridia bacterium]|nr:AEC family transporter [Clostridia bacterium]